MERMNGLLGSSEEERVPVFEGSGLARGNVDWNEVTLTLPQRRNMNRVDQIVRANPTEVSATQVRIVVQPVEEVSGHPRE